MQTKILSYKFASESAKLLADSLGSKRIKPDGDYKYKENDLIVNLGFSGKPKWDNDNVAWMNKPESISIAVCKKKTFKKLKEHGVSIPEFTESKEQAIAWIGEGYKVVCREILNGHSAQGIVIAHSPAELSAKTKLYVKYFPKKHEYRVHLIRDKESLKIFDFIQKKKKSDIPEAEMNYEVRNHGQWIFARDGVELPNCVKVESIKAAEALGLDLCSVDVCYNVQKNSCVVLECNTCSSLSGDTTLENYTKAIKDVLLDKVINKVPVKMSKPIAIVNSIPPESKAVAPMPTVAVAKPAINVKEAVKTNKGKKYILHGVSDLEITQEGNIMRFYGKVQNVPKPVKVLETTNGEVSYFWED